MASCLYSRKAFGRIYLKTIKVRTWKRWLKGDIVILKNTKGECADSIFSSHMRTVSQSDSNTRIRSSNIGDGLAKLYLVAEVEELFRFLDDEGLESTLVDRQQVIL